MLDRIDSIKEKKYYGLNVLRREEGIMSKEKLQYNNITPVQVRGQTKYRFSTRGADNKISILQGLRKKDLTPISG